MAVLIFHTDLHCIGKSFIEIEHEILQAFYFGSGIHSPF